MNSFYSVRPLILEKPSRSGGPAHQVGLHPETLTPLGCTCRAGQTGSVCHAALDVAADDAYWLAWDAMLAAGTRHGWSSQEYKAAAKRFDLANRNRYAAEAETARREGKARRAA